VTSDALRERCVSSFRRLQQQSEYVVVEGTGHIGVGSIVGLNNAQVVLLPATLPVGTAGVRGGWLTESVLFAGGGCAGTRRGDGGSRRAGLLL
jgi:hypothetical protein